MKLKVCGMKHNPLEVASLGPDFLGFILWKPSPRYYGEAALPDLPEGVIPVGVFVDEPADLVLGSASRMGLEGIQLHGAESPAYCTMLRESLKTMGLGATLLFKAFSVGPGFRFESVAEYLPVCDYFLFDTRGELPGGTGKTFDWELLREYPFEKPYFLSGGIGESHCDQLRAFLGSPQAAACAGIDINSRFETAPGQKDTEALKRFMDCAFWREAGRNIPGNHIKTKRS